MNKQYHKHIFLNTKAKQIMPGDQKTDKTYKSAYKNIQQGTYIQGFNSVPIDIMH